MPSDDEQDNDLDPLVLHDVYQDPQEIFSFQPKSLSDVFDNALGSTAWTYH